MPLRDGTEREDTHTHAQTQLHHPQHKGNGGAGHHSNITEFSPLEPSFCRDGRLVSQRHSPTLISRVLYVLDEDTKLRLSRVGVVQQVQPDALVARKTALDVGGNALVPL